MLRRPPPSRQADRQRRHRARAKRGEAVLNVVVAEADFLEALIRSARLTEGETTRRSSVEQAAASVLADWTARWKI